MLYPSVGTTDPSAKFQSAMGQRTIPTPSVAIHGAVFNSGTKSLVNQHPVNASRSGLVAPGVNDQFYNNIIINPSSINLGNLTAIQTREVTLWNGYSTSKSVSDLIGTDVVGISLAQPETAPFILKPLEELHYSISASTDGPATIDGYFTWTINGVAYKLVISGRRIILLQVPPNWSSSFVESLDWLTDVIKAYSGKEQRRSLRADARRQFEYDFLIQKENAQTFENQLWGWQNRSYALPIYTDIASLSAAAVAGSSVLALATGDYSFTSTELAILIGPDSSYEIVQVDSVSSGNLVLTNPTQNGWPLHTKVFPVAVGRLPSEVQYKRYTDSTIQGKITFSCLPGTVGSFTDAGSAVTTYNGYEVVTYHPNWSGGIDFTGSFESGMFDSNVGLVDYFTTATYARITRQHSWLLSSRSAITAFRHLLGRLRGQYGTVYVPTWNSDFTLARDHYATEDALYVTPNMFRQMVGIDANRNKLMIRLKNGTCIYRTITSIGSDGDYDVIGLDSTLGANVMLNGLSGIHLMLLSRLATDKVQLTWHTSSVVTATLNFKTVPV